MGGIIPLQDPHRRTQLLLPWRANGTLEPDEEAAVTAHLEQCAECRDDLAFERELAANWASVVPETDSGLARVRAKIEAQASRVSEPQPLLRRPVRLSRAIAAQIATAAMVGTLFVVVNPAPDEATYEALGAKTPPSSGNIVVLFAPGTTVEDVRSTLPERESPTGRGPAAPMSSASKAPRGPLRWPSSGRPGRCSLQNRWTRPKANDHGGRLDTPACPSLAGYGHSHSCRCGCNRDCRRATRRRRTADPGDDPHGARARSPEQRLRRPIR